MHKQRHKVEKLRRNMIFFNCKFLPPNGCRDSLKSKTCSRKDCHFFHLTGTKMVEPKWQSNKNAAQCPNLGGCETQNRFEVLQNQCQNNCNSYQTQSVSKQICGSSSQTHTPKPVFQQDLSNTDLKIEALSKQMDEIHLWMRNQNQSQNQKSNSADWRH